MAKKKTLALAEKAHFLKINFELLVELLDYSIICLSLGEPLSERLINDVFSYLSFSMNSMADYIIERRYDEKEEL